MLLQASTTLHKGVKNTNNSYKLLFSINIQAYTNTIKDCDSHKGHVVHVREGFIEKFIYQSLFNDRPNVLMNVCVLITLLSHMKLDYLELTVLAQPTNMLSAIFGHIVETP